MFRAALKQTLSARRTMASAGLESSFHSSALAMGRKAPKYNSKNVPSAPGGSDRELYASVEMGMTLYTVQGTTAAEIKQLLRTARAKRATTRAADGPSSCHSSPPAMSKKYNPKEWRIIPGSPGGFELMFINLVDRRTTCYTPEGMTAAEIMRIPRAKRFFTDEEEAEDYIKEMTKEKKWARENGVCNE